MDRNDALLHDRRTLALALEAEVGKVLIGQARVVRLVTIALFARGHVLLEGGVGVGKTTALRAFARALGGAFARVEGSVDLLPNDLLYYTWIDAEGQPRVDPGPLIARGEHLACFFFNEINRARPQVHAMLLRVMAERSIGAFGREYHFPHLTVFADRNRVEREETFEISSAARDRFMLEIAIEVPGEPEVQTRLAFDPRFHDADGLVETVQPALLDYAELNPLAEAIQRNVQASPALERYALELWRASSDPAAFGVRLEDVDLRRLMTAGASPRGMSMLLRAARVAAWLAERNYLVPEDLQDVFAEAMSHRLFFEPVYELRRARIAPALVREILARVAAP